MFDNCRNFNRRPSRVIKLERVGPDEKVVLRLLVDDAVELELDGPFHNHGSEVLVLQAGFFCELTPSRLLCRLIIFESASGREPPGSGVGSAWIPTPQQEDGPVGRQHNHTSRMTDSPFQRHAETVLPATPAMERELHGQVPGHRLLTEAEGCLVGIVSMPPVTRSDGPVAHTPVKTKTSRMVAGFGRRKSRKSASRTCRASDLSA